MKFLKALTQKKLAKAVVCGLVLSGSMFVGMGQADAAVTAYIYGAGPNPSLDGAWVGNGTEVKVTGESGITGYQDYEGGNIYGSYKDDANVTGAKITISGGDITGAVYGGYSNTSSGTVEGNTVNISGGNFTKNVYGGYSKTSSGPVEGNTVNISGGIFNGNVYGGYSYISSGTVKENTINISGGTFNKGVYGGYGVSSGIMEKNIINLIGDGGKLGTIDNKGAVEIKSSVCGSNRSNYNDNTLNVAGKNISVSAIYYFKNLNFYIQDGLTYGDHMVNISRGYDKTNISNAKVNVIVEAKPQANKEDANLKSINLLSDAKGITWKDSPEEGEDKDYTIVVKDGAKLTLDNSKNGVALSEDGTALVLTLGGIEESNGLEIKPTSAATALFEDIVKNSDKMPESINEFWRSAVSSVDSSSVENFQAAVSGAFQASEITGTTSTAVSVVNNVSNLTFSRMSLVDSASVNGGKGVGLMAPDSGADVWARYVHGKDKADGINMDGGSSDYSNNYNGVVVGADFKKVGKFQSGISFSYVKGSGNNSFKDTMGAVARWGHTDFHSYNFGYYGSVKNDDTNTMFDLSYGTTSADSDTNGVGGAQSFSSKSKIFNAGVTAEKSFDVSGMKLVPYTGLRYMHVDGGEYTDSLGINHNADKQNVFMLPVGLKLSKENKLSHDWTLTPKLDLSYTWNMGDTDSEMTVSVPGLTTSRLGYSVMDTGSFMGVAGVEAQRKNWTYGVSYAYQKGSHQDSKKIIADIKMSF